MEYNLKLTGDEINVIWLALQKQPYELVATTITKINKQINEQTVIDLSKAEVVNE